MGIDAVQLRCCVIRPVLRFIGLWSESAENLLMGTAAQESALGRYVKQIKGPALGVFEMEPTTHDDLHVSYLRFRPGLQQAVTLLCSAQNGTTASELVTNLAYAAAMARVQYYRVPEALPDSDDVAAMARYWKRYYNTYVGRGTVSEFIQNYQRYVSPYAE